VERNEIYSIAEQSIEIINPLGMEKLNALASAAGLSKGDRVLDVGCGSGEMLVEWAARFGVSGVGVDLNPGMVERSRAKAIGRGVGDRLEFVSSSGAEYKYEIGAFALGCCIGADFAFGGFRESIRALKPALKDGGRLAVGGSYWLRSDVPDEIALKLPYVTDERELLGIVREEGFELEYLTRASQDGWDEVMRDHWRGFALWLRENPDHEDCGEVLKALRELQDVYFDYEREYHGWAVYLLGPALAK